MPDSATLKAPAQLNSKLETRNLKLQFGLLPLLARILVTPIFLQAGVAKVFDWQGNVQYVATRHITWPPLVALMLGSAAAIEIFASLAVLLGFKTRPAALIMFFYTLVLSVIFHNFWALQGMSAAMNQTHFLKNLGIAAALAMLAAYGPGMCSLDARRGADCGNES
jgi:putative oxidoreductase